MTTLSDFILGAASYYGVPLERLMGGSTVDTTQGEFEVVLRVALTVEDVASIAARAQRMALERKVDEWIAAEPPAPKMPSREERRKQWEGLSDAGRAVYGSFHRFTQSLGDADPYASPVEWVGRGGPEVQPVELPAHVYLPPDQATEQQKVMAVGRDGRGWYAVDPADLTPEQMQDYGPQARP